MGGHALDLTALLLRLVLGATIAAHGWNHAFGGGRIAGTAGWFGSIGMRRPLLQAYLATVTELGTGALLALGLLTPIAAAGVVGTMLVALVTVHAANGFFIFRPGQGYEYVVMIIVVAIAAGASGGGSWSLDHALGIDFGGWTGLLISGVLGLGSGASTLAAFFRPAPAPTEPTTEAL